MAKLPFQQSQFLPGTQVADFRTSGITPPPSLDGVIQAGSQYYQSRMEAGNQMMNLGSSIAQAIMVDHREGERKKKIAENALEDRELSRLDEQLFTLEKIHANDPAAFETAARALVTSRSGGARPDVDAKDRYGLTLRSFREEAEDNARSQGLSEAFITRLGARMETSARSSRRGMFRTYLNQEERQLARKRTAAQDSALNRFDRKLLYSEMDMVEQKPEVLPPEKIERIETAIDGIVDEVVSVLNGYSGASYPDDESLKQAKVGLKAILKKKLITKEGTWNFMAINNRLEKFRGKETNAYKRVHNNLVQDLVEMRVLETYEKNQNYEYDRDEIRGNILTDVNSEAWKIYPRKEDKDTGKDLNELPRQRWIDEVMPSLETKYLTENGQLRVEAAREAIAARDKEEAEAKRIANLNDTETISEAQNKLNASVIKINSDFIGEVITDEEAEELVRNQVEGIFNVHKKFIDKRDSSNEKEAKKAFNKKLRNHLNAIATSDSLSWAGEYARIKKAERKQNELLEKQEREKFILNQVDQSATDYKDQYVKLYLEQKGSRKDWRAFETALEGVVDQIVFDRAGDFPFIFDKELASAIREELRVIVIKDAFRVAEQQTDDAIELEAKEASLAYVHGRKQEGDKPAIKGMRQIIKDAEEKNRPLNETMIEVYNELQKLEGKINGEFTNEESRYRFFNKSHDLNLTKEAQLEGLRDRVSTRQDGKLKAVIQQQMNDIATGRDLGQFSSPARNFRDQMNLLTNYQEADWRMSHIAAMLEPHVGDTGLWSRVEAINLIQKYAHDIDHADALRSIENDPIQAEVDLREVKEGDPDALYPSLNPKEREVLHIRAKESADRFTQGSKTELMSRFDSHLTAVLTGDPRVMEQYGFTGSAYDQAKAWMDQVISGDVGPGKLFEEWESEEMKIKLFYAQDYANATNGTSKDEDYGKGVTLENKSLIQLQSILRDLDPQTWMTEGRGADVAGKKEDRRFMEGVHGKVVSEIGKIITKRSVDPAHYPSLEYAEMLKKQGREMTPADMFSRERIEYLEGRQMEYGGPIKLLTNQEIEFLDNQWKQGDAGQRAAMLLTMKQSSETQTLLARVFDDLVEGSSLKYSDQFYLEYADQRDDQGNALGVLKRGHTARNMKPNDIASSLSTLKLDDEDLSGALADDEDLLDFLERFRGAEDLDKFGDWYDFVEAYAVTYVNQGMKDLPDAVELAVRDLFTNKYHVHSGNPFNEKIQGTSLWIDKSYIPNYPAEWRDPQTGERGMFVPGRAYDLITEDDISDAMMKFLREEAPGIVGDKLTKFMLEKNIHFLNSDDGQGLALHFVSADGTSNPPVMNSDNTEKVEISWKKLFDLILDARQQAAPPEYKAWDFSFLPKITRHEPKTPGPWVR